MPTPPSERRRLERELAELLVQLGALRDELASIGEAGPLGRFRRRRLVRQAAQLERRLVDLRERCAALSTDGD